MRKYFYARLEVVVAAALCLFFAGCGGGSSSGPGNNGGGNSSAPVVLSFTVSPASVSPGSAVQFSWKTENASSVSITPGNIGSQPANGSFMLNPGPSSTTSYTLTAMGQNGATVTSKPVTVTVVAPAAPTVQLSATPNPVGQGSFVTLSWNTTGASSISFTPPVTQEDQTLALPQGSVSVPVQQTTTFVATVTGAGGTATASLQVQVVPQPTLIFNASPSCIQAGQTSTLTFEAKNATAVTIVDQNGVQYPVTGTSGSIPVTPTSQTTYTATATGSSGANNVTATAVVNVGNCPQGLANIKHIIFFAQENRSFDMYFGGLAPYRAAHGFGAATDIDSWTNLSPPPVLTGLQGISHSPFHERTQKTDNLTPSWNESHSDVHRPGQSNADQNGQCSSFPKTCDQTSCKMDNFMKRTSSIPSGLSRDPNGDRAIGFYDERDLPFYYELASQFATSDRWFSPTLASTIVNRRYLFAATSSGETFTQPSCVGCLADKTIFDALDAAGISWKYYHIDNSVFLANYAIWNNPQDQGRVRNISEWFSILSQPNADQLLPDVVFIERGSSTGLDEHPSSNITPGAAESAKIINALLGSSAWKDSAFIFTFDEAGGLYDHVPPFPEPEPDSIPPQFRPGDSCAQFNESGFRLPLIVVSPWVKPHFVSHVNRDNTAILKFIEDTFGVPPLTARDAAQDDMSEFFDFSSPHLLTPPPLPQQPVCPAGSSPCDDQTFETFH